MLLELGITGIALIEKLRVELGPGLNVLTGETGAGKSIVVDALTLALGGRADRSLIRTGQDRARVEAVFDASGNREALALLEEMGLDAEGGLVPVARELTSAGRSLCRVCASVVPLQQLRALTQLLVDVHGQHEHQQLCDPARHLAFLDAYGEDEHRALMDRARLLYLEYAQAKRALEKLSMEASERERLRDMLTFQLGEIDAVKPKAGEDDALARKNALLRNAQRVSSGVSRAYDLVYRGAGRGMSAQEALKRAAEALEGLSGLDERFDQLKARLDELFYSAEDVGYELQALEEGLEFDPAEADRIAARLSELKRLERKYGPDLNGVIAFRAQAAARLAELEGGSDRAEHLKKRLSALESELESASGALTRSRKALAQTFSDRLLGELKDLGMARARFEARFERVPERYSARGADRVEFLLSANPGEPVKPLGTVASGGELSRIMLAMKVIAADNAGVDAMVFDEIDTGISGRMAQVVGEKMAAIARKRQVICVTHLPQIAALGDWQYLVEKTQEADRTGSTVRLLDRAGRVDELARMVGGAGGQLQSGRDHAQNLLDAAQALVAQMDR